MSTRIGPASAPMAFLSDIHGNLPALEAVLSELSQSGIVDIFVAGDLLLGGDEPLEVYRTLKRIGAQLVKGPTDQALATIDPSTLTPTDDVERQRLNLFRETKKALGELVLRDLSQLPNDLRIPMIDGRELLMVHGSPAGMTEAIGHEQSDQEIEALLCDDPADIFICGASHVPMIRVIEEIEVCNVGSVGESPEGPNAHYTVVAPRINGATLTQHHVTYR